MSILDDIKKNSELKHKVALDELRDISKLVETKSSDYGPVSEVLDLVFALTRYKDAPVPGGEVQGCARVLSKMVRYMNLRANELIDGKHANTDSMEDSMKDLLGEAARLCAEVQLNRR